MINGHGDDGYLYKREIVGNFSTNTWYGGPDAGLQQHLQEKITTIDRYPDPGAEGLQAVIAAEHGLDAAQLLVTNGATEAIYLVAQAFSGQTVTIVTPAFAEYEDACVIHGLTIHYLPWQELTAETSFTTAVVFICNPNNPTGAALSVATMEQLFKQHPHCCFVIDEAYMDFTNATSSLLPVLMKYPNCVLLRSLTKSFCIPGLRLGFVVSNSTLIKKMRRFKMPWSVNSMAIEAGYYIYHNSHRMALPLQQLLAETAALQQAVKKTTDWHITPSATHYFLVQTNNTITAADLKQYLVQEHGLLIRDASNFRGLTPYHFRIACRRAEHNQLLIKALEQCRQTMF